MVLLFLFALYPIVRLFPTRRSSDLKAIAIDANRETAYRYWGDALDAQGKTNLARDKFVEAIVAEPDRKSTRLNSSHRCISYAVFCLKKKKIINSKIMRDSYI